MNTRRRLTVGATVAASLAAAALAVAIPRAALAHGAMLIPGSRTWLCYEDAITPQGSIVPNNPACAAAVAQSGTNSLYNWFAVLRSDGAGRTRGFSGADLAAVVDMAAETALRETLKTGKMRAITEKDFVNALKSVKPTTEEWLATARNYAQYANQTGTYDAISAYLAQKHD